MSEIKIKAKKISDVTNIDDKFSINQFSQFLYLILSYKDDNSLPQNFKISLKQFIETVIEKQGIITESDIQFIKYMISNNDYIYTEDVNNITDNYYIFTYALESDFLKDNNGNLYINDNIKNLSYTQNTIGMLPENNGTTHNGFYIKNYNNKNNIYSFIWDEHVLTGNVWIIIPNNFFDLTTNSFLDNKSHKYKICDSLSKEPIDPIDIKTTTWNDVQYILFCFSQNGAIGKVYFKQIS